MVDVKASETGESEYPEVGVLTRDELMAIVDRDARRDLGMSGAEFLRKWNAGEFDAVGSNGSERREVVRLAMLLPRRE